MPAAIGVLAGVSCAQQERIPAPEVVPFGAVFDTKLSRLWNVAAVLARRGKRIRIASADETGLAGKATTCFSSVTL
jgi:hypothetical protein